MAVPRVEVKFQTARVKRLRNESQFREERNLFRRRDQPVPIPGRERYKKNAVIPRLAKRAEGSRGRGNRFREKSRIPRR